MSFGKRTYDPFGRLDQDERHPDPEIDEIKNLFELSDSVGANGKNNRIDVAKVETMLAQAGAHDLTKTDGATGYWGMALDENTRKFQKNAGEVVDAHIERNGPTHRALVETAQKRDVRDAAKRRKERRGKRPTPGSSDSVKNPFDYRDFIEGFSVEPKDSDLGPDRQRDRTPSRGKGSKSRSVGGGGSRGGGGGGGYWPNPKQPHWLRRGPHRWNM